MHVARFFYRDEQARKQAFDIRRKVFIEEQKVEEREEFDPFEEACIHYLAFNDEDQAMGTARWRFTERGIKFERFAVLREFRKTGVGKALCEAMLCDVPADKEIYLHAQVQVTEFYEGFDFHKVGDVFVECDIDHYEMVRPSSLSGISLKRSIDCVRDFHQAFGLHIADQVQAEIPTDLAILRYKLMREENEEYFDAVRSGDLVEIADALGDMLYILNGTIITHGLQDKISAVFEEIQRSNMSKLDDNGKPIYRGDGKVMKSDRYFKPDIETILKS